MLNIKKYIVVFAQVLAIIVFQPVVKLFCTRPTESRIILDLIKKRPHLIVANHRHALDPFLLTTILPVRAILRLLPVGFMTLNFFYNSPLKPGAWLLGCFPARNKSGKEKLYGIKGANRLIKSGYSVQIFPEGTRIRDNGRHKVYPGVIVIHQANPEVPIILCHVEHNKGLKAMLRRRWFVIHFALEENVHYTDSNKLMDKIYELPRKKL
jgi:1-acyl-sn-glycerol-3-phosphate acyltransferase